MHGFARIVFMVAITAALTKSSLLQSPKAELQGDERCFQVLFIIGDLARKTASDFLHGEFEKASADAMSLFQHIVIAIRCTMKDEEIRSPAEFSEAQIITEHSKQCYKERFEQAYQEMMRGAGLILSGKPEEMKSTVMNVIGMLRNAMNECHETL